VVALVFGYAGPAGGTSPTVAILLAAGFRPSPFSALAAITSVSRLLNIVRVPLSSRPPDSLPGDRATVRPSS
jgi:hypothetical protein